MEFLKELLTIYAVYIPVCVGIGLLLGTGTIVLIDMLEQPKEKNKGIGED